MVGTTQARVNFFMNRFRKLGFIAYNGSIEVHPSLLSVVLPRLAVAMRLANSWWLFESLLHRDGCFHWPGQAMAREKSTIYLSPYSGQNA